MTTVVAYGARFAVLYPFATILSLDLNADSGPDAAKVTVLRTVAVSVGWVVGVIFAYFTNKHWVFRDKVRGKGNVARQFGKFVASRLGTYFVEWAIGVLVPMALLALGYKTMHIIVDIDADMIAMVISVVVVTVLNYILSKLLVFKKKRRDDAQNDN